ncbi:MAG: phosphatidylserine decarboxylase [Desulfobacterales bacterium]|nr:MAG: phosphatidylserine decarboxylase [Desulfobacterales bacterium]
MNDKIIIRYFDRREGLLKTERVHAGKFLHWSYNMSLGRVATELIFRQKLVSRLYGWLHKQQLSKRKIKPFVQKMGTNLDELTRPIEDFTCFNDFFTREIDLSKRSINQNPCVCIAPVDGKILAYGVVEPDMTFRIKRSTFNLRGFLQDATLLNKFSEGSMVVSRLCLTDYHHFHFPDSGIPGEAISVRGKYYASGPYGLRALIPFYTQNYRVLTLFDSDHFGQIAIVEIGAFTVGSIQQRYQSGRLIAKGARNGFFELGGSTVVLLFEKGRIELDKDLVTNTKNEVETYVLLGDSIGRTPKRR